MKKLLLVLAFLLSFGSLAQAQQSVYQSFAENTAQPPAAVLVGQNYSTSTNTGASSTSTGGSVAAGSYRIGATCFSSSNTETALSTDTAATAVITTTGATSTVTVYPPVCVGASNEVGYRVYIGGNGGASGAETLQTLNSTVCTLSSSATASCSLQSPAVFTASTNFTGGGGGPATPGTLIFPALSSQATLSLFENSLYPYNVLSWVVAGTAPTSCTVQIQTGATIVALANAGQALTCTSSGVYALPSFTPVNFISLNVSAYASATNYTSLVTFYLNGQPIASPYFFGNAAPTGTCPTGGVYTNTAGGVSTTMYTCNAGTWTAVTVP